MNLLELETPFLAELREKWHQCRFNEDMSRIIAKTFTPELDEIYIQTSPLLEKIPKAKK
jgi:hypothetical protein